MLHLPSVTLLCIDCVDAPRAARAIDRCTSVAQFGAVKFLTSIVIDRPDVRRIAPIRTLDEYSSFMLKKSYAFVDTEHMLVVQHDGFITSPAAWSDEFLSYDYVGAPWMNGLVGNGGFSLRTRRLMRRVSELIDVVPLRHSNEDEVVCLTLCNALERDGFKFAPTDVAARFSVEHNDALKKGDTFGFHGKHLMKRVAK